MRISNEKAMRMMRSGQRLYRIVVHVKTNRFVVPHTEEIEAYPDPQYFNGKRKHIPAKHDSTNYGYPTFLFNGNWAPAWFTKKKQADKFCEEIVAGLHPIIVASAREYDLSMDFMDEAFGIDRGLGTIVDDEDDYPYDVSDLI